MSKQVLDYHQKTKHSFKGYAPSPGFLDWDDQPNPFRTFEGSTKIPLTLVSCDAPPPKTLASLDGIAYLFQFSLALNGWKSLGPDRWSMRVNPSSGNLHPTEAYIIVWKSIPGLMAGIYHYNAYFHQLELRCAFHRDKVAQLNISSELDGIAIAFSTIGWREEWKYGPRAFRYCQLDVGHAVGAVAYSASLLNATVMAETKISDADLAEFLGLNRAQDFDQVEMEDPDLFLILSSGLFGQENLSGVFNELAQLKGKWYGKASQISQERIYWPDVKALKPVVERPANLSNKENSDVILIKPVIPQVEAQTLIKRRSAQRMDKASSCMPKPTWLSIVNAIGRQDAISATLGQERHISLVLLVHPTVEASAGLYFLSRNSHHRAWFQKNSQHAFDWTRQAEQEDLYLLQRRDDTSKLASKLSCYQGIAGHGSFCVFMLGDMSQLTSNGAWMYRNLHIEAGLLGHKLYIEAETQGYNGTGIGCFFDDEVQALLGLPKENSQLQVLYHFTVGRAKTDARLETSSAYHHLTDQRDLELSY